MTTVTGKIEDAAGRAVHCAATFLSKSTPIVGSGVIVGNTSYRKMTDTNGNFSVTLAAGKYQVTYATRPQSTTFEITVPETYGSTVSIETVTSSSLVFIYVEPNTVWNGSRAGHITFIPIDDPPQLTLAGIAYGGLGHQTTAEHYVYLVSYQTNEGETALSPTATIAGVNNGATRITTETSPTRATHKRIWRNAVEGGNVYYLLTTIDPSVATYEDWESHADFYARIPDDEAPEFNTTAGVIYATPTDRILYLSSSGLRCLSDATFDEDVDIAKGVTISGTGRNLSLSVTGNSALPLIYTTTGGEIIFENVDNDGTSYAKMTSGGFYYFNAAGTQKTVWDYTVSGGGEVTTQIQSLRLPTGAVAGYILTCDAQGNTSWAESEAAAASGIMYDGSGNAYSVGIEIVDGVPTYKTPVLLLTNPRAKITGERGETVTGEAGKNIEIE